MLNRLFSSRKQLFSRRWSNFSSMLLTAFAVVVLVSSCVVEADRVETSTTTTSPAATGGANSEITVYTALEDDQIKGYLESFQQQNPNINVNIVRDSTGIVTAKLLAEKDNPQADAIWGLAASSLLVADQQGMLEPYAPAGLEKVQPKFRDEKNPPHWVGNNAWMSAFCVNTAELANRNLPMPKSWADLTNPAFKNQVVMSNPASSGTGFLSVAGILQMMGEEAGWKYLEALHQNIAQYMHSGSRPCKAAGAGEYTVGISFDYRAVRQKNDGEPIEPVFPTEGSGWDIEANALVKKANIKPEAKTFLDWAITEEVAQKYAENFPITAVKADVPIPAGYPADPIAQLAENDLNWAAANRDRILEEWTRRFDSKSEPKTE